MDIRTSVYRPKVEFKNQFFSDNIFQDIDAYGSSWRNCVFRDINLVNVNFTGCVFLKTRFINLSNDKITSYSSGFCE